MSIRTSRRDRLQGHAKVELAVAYDAANDPQKPQTATRIVLETENYRVKAESGKLIDFSSLAHGYAGTKKKGDTDFTGRRELLVQLLPAIRDLALREADVTVMGRLSTLRFLWRTLDEIEARSPGAPGLRSVAEFSGAHRQALVDRKIYRSDFSAILSVINLTRLALGENRLEWEGPPAKGNGKAKHLPDLPDVKRIKNELKRRWFGWRDRYDLAQHLLNLPEADAQKLSWDRRYLLEGLRRFKATQEKYGVSLPTKEQLNPEGIGARPGVFMGYPELCSYFFPDATSIRAAFMLCLATTGWNEAVLLSLEVGEEIFLTHPTDEKRYIMVGAKRRAKGAEQRCNGLKKTQHGPYSIINFLTEVSERLRDQLRARGKAIGAQLADSAALGLDAKAIQVLQEERHGIEVATRSFWLHGAPVSTGPTSGFGGICHLTKVGSYLLRDVIDGLNARNPGQPIGTMSPSDFRDAYALHWYEFSGGDILTVMRALGHRHVGTTVTYTNNVVVRVRNQEKARKVLKAWWGEVEEHGQADPTVVAFTVKHGKPSEEQRGRVKTYRTFMLTQLGTRCSNPHNPPSHVAPHFEPDGKKVCDVQRCLLCVKYAVITPESLDGIARRLAELIHIKSSMSVAGWESATGYIEEMENAELGLAGFADASAVQEAFERWTRKIESGEHRVMLFEAS